MNMYCIICTVCLHIMDVYIQGYRLARIPICLQSLYIKEFVYIHSLVVNNMASSLDIMCTVLACHCQ